jgi:putative ABC transport system substrate-binding protein
MLRILLLVCALIVSGISPAPAAEAAHRYRVAFITYASATEAFNAIVKAALSRIGYREGDTVEYRAFNGERNMDEMKRQAALMADWKPDVILSMMTNADLAVRDVTKTSQTPVIFWSTDPVGSGFAASYRTTATSPAFPSSRVRHSNICVS